MVNLFQNCAPNDFDESKLSLSKLESGSSEGGSGNPFDGKIFYEQVLCEDAPAEVRSTISLRSATEAWMTRDSCQAIEPVSLDQSSWELVSGQQGALLIYAGRIYSEKFPNLESAGTEVSPQSFGRFIFEFGDQAEDQVMANRGATHQDGENLTYLGIGYSASRNSSQVKSLRWEGITGVLLRAGEDNKGGEHRGGVMGLWHVRGGDYKKALTLRTAPATEVSRVAYLRLIGGSDPPTVVHSRQEFHGLLPKTLNLNVRKGDIIVFGGMIRTQDGGEVAASNMTRLQGGSFGIYAATADQNGVFSTRITGNEYQQWGWILTVFRAN